MGPTGEGRVPVVEQLLDEVSVARMQPSVGGGGVVGWFPICPSVMTGNMLLPLMKNWECSKWLDKSFPLIVTF